MKFDTEFDDFYRDCLAELRGRENYTDAFLPLLERYVTITATLSKLNAEIIDESITISHTNKAKKKNQVTSPKWRMFIMLNREANALAKDLKLSPISAPPAVVKEKKKGFDLSPMKVAK